MRRLTKEELFRIVPGRDPLQAIGDDTLTQRLNAAELQRIGRQSDPGYRDAVGEECLQMPEST